MKYKEITYRIVLLILSFTLIISCSKESTIMQTDSSSGVGGSTARFTISNGHLYTVDNTNLKVFDISSAENPQYIKDLSIGFGIETIFPQGNNLFLGSRTGMTIYDISIPSSPQYVSNFSHIYSCDPVVVEGNYAYITLSIENTCSRGTNELQVIDISNLLNPSLVKIYPMSKPKGLGIDNGTLFICDNGLNVYNASDVNNIRLLQSFDISANDVIPYNGKLLVIGDNGFYQYDYSNNQITLLSSLEVSN